MRQNEFLELAPKRESAPEVLAQRRGQPVYASNPSVPNVKDISKRKPVRLGDDKRGFVVDAGEGEVIGIGGASFYEFEEVDDAKFVKMFLAGIKQTVGLSKSGLAMFEKVYRAVGDKPGADKIELPFLASGVSKHTYYNGLKELLLKGFIFHSVAEGVFFVNIQYMFNGDRLAFVRGFQRKRPGRKKDANEDQAELAL